ncbi:MAG: LysR family transcriptional regulator [Myxococcota bacterium]|jgi:DNA-binding transcriptional LysR family regulator|nr:LysR family transcriptional regulator [Myxococcota bacterium]
MLDILYMHQTHLAGIDLNLLVALDALLRERSVTRAAAAVGLSQPAMSRALARLRDLLNDPLLVRHGHAMVPTPRAIEITTPLAAALEAVRRTLEGPAPFDPATASREFKLSAADTTQPVVLPRLLARIGESAGGVEVSTFPLRSNPTAFAGLASGQLDLAIGRFDAPPEDIRLALLYRDAMVCVARRDHPRIRRRLTLRRYLAEGHLAAESDSPVDRPFTIESILGEQGLARRVACTVENLAMAPYVVAGTDLICSAPRTSIEPFASGLGLRIFEPPFPTPGFNLHLAWHQRMDRDPGHQWIREMTLELFADMRDD